MSLKRILQADSVAVIGASKVETKRGFQAIRTLRDEGYEGQVYPVNPRESEILGLACYPSVGDIPHPVDLALITTPARTVPGILEQCAAKGIAGAVLIAGGFGEAGEQGRALQAQVADIARRTGVRLIGPNTSGMMNVHKHLNLVGLPDVPAGDLALLSQSGNMALALITEARMETRKGLSYYVGVGNEADLHFHEHLAFLRDDPETAAVICYVEGMHDGRSFLAEASVTTRIKPVVLLKSGRSEIGRSAAGSHSGSLAGSSEVARAALERAGVVVVERTDELLAVAEALSSLPPVAGNNIAILADGGGHATIAADALTDLGVTMNPLRQATQDQLTAILPAAARVSNPVDVAGGTDANPELFADCARILLQDPGVGGVLVVGLFGGYGIRFAASLAAGEESAAAQMGEMVREFGKPVVMHSLYKSCGPRALQMLQERGIPVQGSLEVACTCIGALARRGRMLASAAVHDDLTLRWRHGAIPRGQEIIDAARADGREVLLEHEARELLALHGATVGPGALATTAEDAVAAAAGFDGPVALKLVSPQILHKSDAGGVQLGIEGAEAVRGCFDRIVANAHAYDPGAEVRGVLVSPMAARGVEVIVGTTLDDQFGPVLLFGIGGVLVEVLEDVVFRVIPVSERGAGEMIEEIRARKLLDGFRGSPPADREAIRRLLVTVSELVQAYPDIRTMDLNPVLVHESGLTAVDARILLTPA